MIVLTQSLCGSERANLPAYYSCYGSSTDSPGRGEHDCINSMRPVQISRQNHQDSPDWDLHERRKRAERPTKGSCSDHSTNSPGGCEHKRKDSIRLPRKALQDRQRECGCLATAGVSRSEHVAPLEDGRDAPALHLCGPHHAQRFAHPAQPAGQGSYGSLP